MEHIDFEPYLQETTQEIIIFGTGKMSHYLYDACVKSDIMVSAFCDNDATKWGQENHGVEILSLAEIQAKYKSPIFLVALLKKKHQESIAKQLEDVGFTEYYSLIHCVENMKNIEIPNVFERISLLQVQHEKHEKASSPVMYAREVTLTITTKCTLRCQDCAAFIPYHEEQKHIPKEVIFQHIDKLDEIFDTITFLAISGGEALMHPDVYEILAYAQSKPTFQYVVIYTNATIVPKKEELLKFDTDKVLFSCSNYGVLSIKQTELLSLLQELNIKYMSPPEMTWFDCTKLNFRGKTESELKKTYQECFNDCIVVIDEKLFRCSQVVSAYLLNALPKNTLQYVELMDDTKTKEDLQQEIKKYLYGMEYLEACNWCTGKTATEKTQIPPAIQVKGNLPYKKYMD